MSLIPRTVVTLDDALGFLSARTFSPSTMGTQLEAARDRAAARPRAIVSRKTARKAKLATRDATCGGCGDPIAIGSVVVGRRGGPPVHLRCYGERDIHEGIVVKAPASDGSTARDAAEDRLPRDAAIVRCLDGLAAEERINGLKKTTPSLARLHREVVANGSERTQGELVIQCLRAYEERKLRSQEHALAAVYAWAHGRAPEVYAAVEHDEDTLAQAFRVNKAAKARRKAAELYADCYLALSSWIGSWNRKRGEAA